LIDARAETIGSRLEACVTCGECGTLLEATVECRELIPDPPDAFDLACDNCGKRSSSVFDIRAFFWRELSARAQQIVLDVHDLARAYGWRESDVLSLSPARRRRYLELVGEPGPFERPHDEEWDIGVAREASVAVAGREPGGDGPSNTPGAIRRAVVDAENRPPTSFRISDETVANPPMQERARRHHAVRATADRVNRLEASPARLVAAASRRETATVNSPISQIPQVTVNIARIDVVATPVQAATIGARQKRREAAMPLSSYLADRETETR
jgi:hypothetical protein